MTKPKTMFANAPKHVTYQAKMCMLENAVTTNSYAVVMTMSQAKPKNIKLTYRKFPCRTLALTTCKTRKNKLT